MKMQDIIKDEEESARRWEHRNDNAMNKLSPAMKGFLFTLLDIAIILLFLFLLMMFIAVTGFRLPEWMQ